MTIKPITVSQFPDTLAAERRKTGLKTAAVAAAVACAAAIAFKTAPLWVPLLVASGPIGWAACAVLGTACLIVALLALRIALSPAKIELSIIEPSAELTSVTPASTSAAIDIAYPAEEGKFNGDFVFAHEKGIAIQLDTTGHGIQGWQYIKRKEVFDKMTKQVSDLLDHNETYTLEDLQKMFYGLATECDGKIGTTCSLSAIFMFKGQKYLAAVTVGDANISIYDTNGKLRDKIKPVRAFDFDEYQAMRAEWIIRPLQDGDRVLLLTDGTDPLTDEEIAKALKESENNATKFLTICKPLLEGKEKDDISATIQVA